MAGGILPVPSQELYHPIRDIICHSGIIGIIANIGQRVRVSSSWGPRHGEDDVEWNTEGFCAVNVGEAWGVGNDRIGDKWLFGIKVWRYA